MRSRVLGWMVRKCREGGGARTTTGGANAGARDPVVSGSGTALLRGECLSLRLLEDYGVIIGGV